MTQQTPTTAQATPAKKMGAGTIILIGCGGIVGLGIILIIVLVIIGAAGIAKVANDPEFQEQVKAMEEKNAVQAVANLEENAESKNQKPAKEEKKNENPLVAAIASDLKPTGVLNDMFKLGSDYTDLQRKRKEEEIKGKVVQWKLEVYEVDTVMFGDGYKIQTSGNNCVGTFITIKKPTPEEVEKIEGLKTGDKITVKGYIRDVTMRYISIEPAILVD